jgi:DNA-binding transcriptional MerR regulator
MTKVMLSIGQVAKMANVSNRTLRYYEELGLIVPKTRGSNRYRYYDETHIQRLNTIKMLQESGFALKEIVAALAPILDPNGNVTYSGQEMAKEIYKALENQRAKLVEKQREIQNTLGDLEVTMKSLVDCFGCKLSASLEDCAKCEKGPVDVTRMGRDLVHSRASGSAHNMEGAKAS